MYAIDHDIGAIQEPHAWMHATRCFNLCLHLFEIRAVRFVVAMYIKNWQISKLSRCLFNSTGACIDVAG